MINQVVWFDVPVVDLDRAIAFYSAVLDQAVEKEDYDNFSIGVLPHENPGNGGCLAVMTGIKPSSEGVLIYLNVNGRLDAAIDAAKNNGGEILQGKHGIGPYGFRAIILDSEGNRIALHSEA
ncbi:MAG: VOC family protein [Gammaproteobacteria bacterium]|nr:VOC family protein [Gammaproteobacteria bacterium]